VFRLFGLFGIELAESPMYRCVGVILLCVAFLSAQGQTSSSAFQPGTIMAVTAHQGPGQHDQNVSQYDVSVKVGKTTYVVLYTPPNGANVVSYAAGDELLVLVGSDKLTFNSPAGKVETPILHRDAPPAQGAGSSKTPGLNFNTQLGLTDAQSAQIRPLLEEEARQVIQLCANPNLSRSDKMSQYENIVQTSDNQIKPMLSASQVQKLRDLRRQQKEDLKKIIARQETTKPN
jgi:hypothetical protein